MHRLLKLSLMLSVLSVTGSVLAQDPIFDDSACLWVNDTLFCAYPKLVYDEGIQIVTPEGEIFNGRHLEAAWWPAPLDWYEPQLRAQCVIDNTGGTRIVTVVGQWGATRLDCPEGMTMADNPEGFKIRIRELP